MKDQFSELVKDPLKCSYRYDSVNNRRSVSESNGDRATWIYDSADQLVAERRSGANGYAITVTYDPVGNRVTRNADSIRTTYVYDNANQLIYSRVGADRTTYVFDSTGNQIRETNFSGTRVTTTWDFENQPIVYEFPGQIRTTILYNGENRRVQKQTAAETVKLVWDSPIDSCLLDLNGSNITQAVYTINPIQFGELISQILGLAGKVPQNMESPE